MYTLRVPTSVSLVLTHLHPNLKKKIKASLRLLLKAPFSGKPLKDQLTGLWSYRIGNIRIIYRIKVHALEIIAIGPRSKIYEEMYLLLKIKNRLFCNASF